MILGGFQKTTLIDYPGKIACTVFLTGCNFRCPFCYSIELVLPEKIKDQPKIAEDIFFDFLKQRKELLDGVVLCGGEPTIHKDLPQFCKKIKKLGYLIKLDTNGSNPEMLSELIDKKLINYVAMDIKAPLKNKYEKMAGVKVNMEDINKSVDILRQGKIDFEFRTTVAPGLEKQDILEIADWIGGEKVKYFLQEFNTQKQVLNPEILKLPILKKEEIEKIIAEIKPKFQTCQLR
ncbi:anaerobic ribonucleoside-triphosphate reductase activating protein [Candidatus Parcubacteria bacterium]|nr:anaerobic ribonucleoside-triphosphate reductase activating protein [Candidatus Parcubacteria bacterium]